MAASRRTRFLGEVSRAATEGKVSSPRLMLALVEAYAAQHRLGLDFEALALNRLATSSAGSRSAAAADSGSHVELPVLPDDLDVGVIGQAYEATIDTRQRHTRGVFYTPEAVADRLVTLALAGLTDVERQSGPTLPLVLDPSVGGGAFLLAAARCLEGRGWSRRTIVEQALWGIDIDPVSVAVTEAMLQCWMAQDPQASVMADDSRSRGLGDNTNDSRHAERARKVVVESHLVVADTLTVGPRAFDHAPEAGFDAVVGNPPFQNQLGAATARRTEDVEAMRAWLRVGPYRYADTATMFLAAALQLVRDGGRVALVLPQSFLVVDDAKSVRDEALRFAELQHLWVALEPVFAVGVHVCAPVLRADRARVASDLGPDFTVERSTGRDLAAAPSITLSHDDLHEAASWAPLVADLIGVPTARIHAAQSLAAPPIASRVPAPTPNLADASAAHSQQSQQSQQSLDLMPETQITAGTLGSFCRATAGFRDQFYRLRPFVREATVAELQARRAGQVALDDAHGSSWAPLITSGLLGPAWCEWGARPTRFAKTKFDAPVVDLDALRAQDTKLAAWTEARLVPKLVVATQSKVIEAAVDEEGAWYPSVPTVALSCPFELLWQAAAVVMAPAVSVWAFQRHAGAALSLNAIKVSARQILLAPLPVDAAGWQRSSDELRAGTDASRAGDHAAWRGAMERFAFASLAAYGLDNVDGRAVARWWLGRLPAAPPLRRNPKGLLRAHVPPETTTGAIVFDA